MAIGRKYGCCVCHLCRRYKGNKRIEGRRFPYITEQKFRRECSRDYEFRKLPKGYRRIHFTCAKTPNK